MYYAGIRKINIVVDDEVDKSQVVSCCYDFCKEINLDFE
ncbi:unnamed protein product, partial [marine sediment metagenome]